MFLHVLRPFVKPYTAVVDPILEISRDLGDFLFALLQVPLDYILSSPWLSWSNGESEEETGKLSSTAPINLADSESSTRTSSHPDIQISAEYSTAMQTSRMQNKHYGSVRSISDNLHSNGAPSANSSDPQAFRDRHLKSASSTSLPAYSEHPSHDPTQYSQTLSGRNRYQIWYPPASTCPPSSQHAPIATLDLPGTAPEYHSPEWRTYPAFPSAYPPTPLPASASLPSSVTSRSDNDHHVIADFAYPPIPEDEQGFGELPERQHKEHPGFVHNSGNSNRIPSGVIDYVPGHDSTQQEDEDTLLDDSICSSEAGLSEDDFGASLRTPHHFPKAMPFGAHSSADSLVSTLAAAGNTTSLRTRKSSESLSSGSSSLAGQKRARAFQGKARSAFMISQSQNGTLRGRVAPPVIPQDPLQSSEGEDESEPNGDDDSTKVKRQRVLDPLKRKSTVRPALRGMQMGGARKALPSRSATARPRPLATASQATTLPSRAGTVTANNSTIKGRKPLSRQIVHGGPQGVVKSSSTSSSRSGTSSGRVH